MKQLFASFLCAAFLTALVAGCSQPVGEKSGGPSGKMGASDKGDKMSTGDKMKEGGSGKKGD